MFAIETHNLIKKYGPLTAVDSLNLTIEKGKIFGLLGPNGAGKSTLLSMLCTITSPTSGSALVNGYDIITQPERVRQSIGIVFQSISVDDRLTGRENLKFHAMLYDVPDEQIEERIEEVLSLLELEDRADSLVKTYSGGMIRRLEMARGLLHHPQILFLDEPTIGLDPQTRDHIWKYIQNLTRKKSRDLTILLTTHYMDEADLLCDDVAIIDHGRIAVRDSPEKLKESLKGEKLVIRTASPDMLLDVLTDSEYILDSTVSEGSVTFKVKSAGRNVLNIIQTARDSDVDVEFVSINEPTLNDVFLHHTGKEIRKEEPDNFLSQYKRRRRRR